ncbi:MAG: YdiU family protein [Deltaproteobacteria bacterium]
MRKLHELEFDNTYSRLPEEFYQPVNPTPFETPHLVSFNPDAASLIGLDPSVVYDPEFVDYFSGKRLIPGSRPIAMYYTGHQFGVYNPDIGDGRAILLGEVRNSKGEKWDLHLKGAGRTKYARVFDGRAVLRSTVREYLCSQAMHGLGIPTTRALCIIGSSERVERETPETGAMMLRVAETHVRFGSFEAFYYEDKHEHVKLLADYVIENHFPRFVEEDDKYALFLGEVVGRTAGLIALWQACGFTHGVMNTDNMSITGLTIDYGPFGFVEEYDPGYIPNHSDHFGRYSFSNQPAIALWNLRKLAKSLSALMPREISQEILESFKKRYGESYFEIMRRKLGFEEIMPEDGELIQELLNLLEEGRADYTNFFRSLSGFSAEGFGGVKDTAGIFKNEARFEKWSASYKKRLRAENSSDAERKKMMDSVNPKYILRNYLAEQAIRKAEQERDYTEIALLHNLLKNPFSEQPELERYSEPAPEWARSLVISCSS